MDFSFLKNPRVCFNKNETFWSKLEDFFLLSLILISLVIIWSFLVRLISVILELNDISFIKDIQNQQRDILFGNSHYFNIVKILVLAPIVEELIFRFPLNLKKYSILTSLSILCFIYIGDNIRQLSINSLGTWIKLCVIVLIIVLGKFCLKKEYLNYVKSNYFKYYFYFTAIVFALIHISNFSNTIPNSLIFITPLFVLPQFFLAIISNYLRLKNGFVWVIFLHFLFNFPATLIYVIKNLSNF